jgi:exoribonuclease R
MLTKQVIGVLELASKYRYGLTSRGAPLYLFRPYSDDLPEYIVGCSARGSDATRNQVALVDIPITFLDPPDGTKHRATLVRLIGPVGDYAAEREGLLLHYCPTKAAPAPPNPPGDATDDAMREELSAATGWVTFHVDPPGCRDVDDAIAFRPDTGTLAITIADAAAAVPPGSAADYAAEAIGATFYDSTGRAVRPMLPPTISEDAASLLPGAPRRGVTLFLYPSGATRWALTWITVAHGFTYESFAGSDTAYAIGATGDPHEWIANLMIRYNAAAAAYLRQNTTGILRTQRAADADAVADWTAVSPELARLAHEAATYEFASHDANQSHAGLDLASYCHASSPLRRYADLANQRALKALITGTPLPVLDGQLVAHLNERTRANRRWARDLTFLERVTPGRVHLTDILWVSPTQVWVPAWSRLLRLRHEVAAPPPPGTRGAIQIFCDPTKRNWRSRILTAPASAI